MPAKLDQKRANKTTKHHEMHHIEQKVSVKNQCITLSEVSLFKAEFRIHKACLTVFSQKLSHFLTIQQCSQDFDRTLSETVVEFTNSSLYI